MKDSSIYSPDLISIIMPCYNGANHIENSIRSALNQTHTDIELIIIDDGSTDNSMEIISGFDDHRIHILKQENRGVCVARNTGLNKAQGEYIAFLDSDDTWAADCLEKLHTALHEENTAALAYCGWMNKGIPGPGSKPFIPPDYEKADKLASLLQSCRWPIHATLTRHNIIKKFQGFDERFYTAEDYYLWLRIGTSSIIVLVPEVLAYYNHHGGPQASKNISMVALDQWFAQKVFLHNHPDVVKVLGKKHVRLITDGELLKKGYECHWKRQLEPSRDIFRFVMKSGYGDLKDWLYMLPCLLPISLHRLLLSFSDKE